MKVAVVGTFSSGKSTLTSDLGSSVRGCQVLSDECRPILTSIPMVDWSAGIMRDYLVVRQIVIEAVAELDDVDIIVDGGVVNNIAHDRALLQAVPNRRALLDSLGHRPYDAVLWCDLEGVKLVDDGQRFLDNSLRRRIDNEIREVLGEMATPYLKVSGSKHERLEKSLRYLDSIR